MSFIVKKLHKFCHWERTLLLFHSYTSSLKICDKISCSVCNRNQKNTDEWEFLFSKYYSHGKFVDDYSISQYKTMIPSDLHIKWLCWGIVRMYCVWICNTRHGKCLFIFGYLLVHYNIQIGYELWKDQVSSNMWKCNV